MPQRALARGAIRSSRAVDQLLNSASSAVFSFGLLVACDARTLGAVAMLLIPVTISLGLARTGLYDGLLMRSDGYRPGDAGLAVAAGAVSGAIVALLGAAVGVAVALPHGLVLALSLATGTVMLFDSLRFAAFVSGRERIAVLADAIWLICCGAGLALMAVVDVLHPTDVAVIYLVSAATGMIPFAGIRLDLGAAWRVVCTRAIGVRLSFGVDHLLQVVPAYVALVLGGALSSLTTVGEVRAAVTIFSPLGSAMYAVRLTLLGPRQSRRTKAGIPGPVLIYALLAATYTVLVCIVFSAVEPDFGGAAGGLSAFLLALVGLGEIGRFATQGFVDEARREGAMGRAIRVRNEQGVLLVVLSSTLVTISGSDGLGLARALAYCIPVCVLLMTARPSMEKATTPT